MRIEPTLIASRVRWSVAVATLLALRWFFPPRDLDTVGMVAVRDLAFTLALWVLFLAISTGIGLRIIRYLALPGLTPLEKLLFAFALGVGTLAYSLLGIGLIGFLNTGVIAVLIIGLSWLLAPELSNLVKDLLELGLRAYRVWQAAGTTGKVTALVAVSIGVLTFVNALSPPWDYDGLMYHLVGPKLFLEAQRVFPHPDNWYVNGPFTVEMLFTVGMSFGDDVFPKLVHYSMGLLFLGATYSIASRWFSQKTALLSVAILLTVPTLPVWASIAYIDLGWSAFEVLGLGALLVWWRERGRGWLLLSGTMIGFAAGSKYLGLMAVAVLGGFVLISTWKLGWRRSFRAGLTFGLTAAIVAAPWYLKNVIWFGNPIFPLVFGGPGWDVLRLELYSAYLDSFGAGRGLIDYLLLPWNVYARHEEFGTVMNEIDIPSLLFLGLLLVWRWPHQVMRALIFIAGARFLLWSLGSQQIRFLLPIYPALAIGAGYVIERLESPRTISRRLGLFFSILLIGLMGVTLFYQFQIATQFNPIPVNIGVESRNDFFSRSVSYYPALMYMQEDAEPADRVLMLGDGRGYLCLPQCVPDPDHFRWAASIARLEDHDSLGQWFSNSDFSYVLLNWAGLDFLLQHDPEDEIRQAVLNLIVWRDAGCLETVFKDDGNDLYSITCGQ